MTTPSSAGARCSFSRKTLLAVAAVSAAGAAVAAAYAKGRKKKRKTSGDMTSSSSSTTLSEEQCNKSWSEQIETEEDHKSVEKEEEKLSTKLGELKVGSSSIVMSRDAKKPVSVNCPDDDAPLAKATDSGVVSPVHNGESGGDNEFVSKKQRSESSDSGGSSGSVGSLIAGSSSSSSVSHNQQHLLQHNGDGAFSDSGQGSEPDDGTIMCYQFKIPSHMTGKLIGLGGQFVKSLKSMTMCHIDIEKNFNRDISRSSSRNGQRNWLPPQDGQPKDYQTVMLEGTRSQIDKCLDLVRERFHNNPEVSLEQTNGSMVPSLHGAPNHFPTPQHALMSSNVLPVFVSALESGTHIFVQQPTHYTFHHVYRLEECMNHVYDGANNGKQHGDCSLSEAELQEALVCVCRSDGKWYRIQLVSKAEDADDASATDGDDKKSEKRSGKWCCRFLDVGGYGWVEPKDLRKIRSDFLELPFQAIECCLANVVPRESVDEFAGAEALRDLTQNKNCFVRLSHFEEGSVPSVDLYYQTDETNEDSRHVLVNRELVNLGLMNWFEAAAETATAANGSAASEGAAEAADAPLV